MRDGLELSVWAAKDHEGELAWTVQYADARFAAKMSKYGRWGLLVFGSENCPAPWPMTGDAEAIDAVSEGFREAASFFVDRKDFARVKAERSNVTRGGVYAELPENNYPARLVSALVLARDLGDDELADTILKTLAEESDDFRGSARRWAGKFAKELESDISL